MNLESVEDREYGTGQFTGLVLQDTYTLGRIVGRGGMGEVYEATHARLPVRMAVKILQPHLRANEDAFARFCREAEIMSTVQHPHIIQIIDFNTAASLGGLPYFVMEYLDGVDLERRLADCGPLSLGATIRIVDAVASALGAAHAAGVVHRDLKPANVFLMRGEGRDADFVKVIDFGISKTRHAGPQLSSASDVFGTPAFMAPEQAQGLVHKIDARTDQFALAAITYAMLTGRHPFVGDDPASLLYQVIHERHPPLSRFVSWDTTAIQPVLDRALAKRRQDRFEGIGDFARALGAAARTSTDARHRSAGEPAPRLRVLAPAPPLRVLAPAPRLRVLSDGRRKAAPAVVESRTVRPDTPFGDEDLPRSIDRIPHGPQRTVALGLAVLGLAALIGYKGWYHGLPGRAFETEHHLRSLAGETWRVFKGHHSLPAPEATPPPSPSRAIEPAVTERPASVQEGLPAAPQPTSTDVAAAPDKAPWQQMAARRVSARRVGSHRRAASRSELPSSPPEDVAASPPPEAHEPPPAAAPEGFPIPEPAPLPAGRDLAPAPAASE